MQKHTLLTWNIWILKGGYASVNFYANVRPYICIIWTMSCIRMDSRPKLLLRGIYIAANILLNWHHINACLQYNITNNNALFCAIKTGTGLK